MDYNATVIAKEEISPGNIVMRIKPDEVWPEFEAGQFAVLGLKTSAPRVAHAAPASQDAKTASEEGLVRRAYSIASASRHLEYLEFFVTLVNSGELTPRLFALEIGSRIHLGPKPKGLFTLDQVLPDRHVVFVATGTGLAPYMSMLRTHLVCGSERRFAIIHGARVSWDLGYRAELETLARLCANFSYIPAITRPAEDPNFGGETGYLQDLVEKDVVTQRSKISLDPLTTDVFLCGNPKMIEAVTALLVARGFAPDRPRQPGNLHTEKYW
ncbi:MAG: ferredoxin--NADP reductase [Planctomycetes bacterium]|nr:ferredoxin--NADP reductase [Planctomycetota bacterium]